MPELCPGGNKNKINSWFRPPAQAGRLREEEALMVRTCLGLTAGIALFASAAIGLPSPASAGVPLSGCKVPQGQAKKLDNADSLEDAAKAFKVINSVNTDS